MSLAQQEAQMYALEHFLTKYNANPCVNLQLIRWRAI